MIKRELESNFVCVGKKYFFSGQRSKEYYKIEKKDYFQYTDNGDLEINL